MKYIEDQEFKDIDYTEEVLTPSEYEYCTFIRCDFSQCNLSSFKFIDSKFVECNLSNVKLEQTAFQEVVFQKCKMLGLRFDACNEFNFSVEFDECVLNHSTFYQVKLNRCSFTHSKLEGVDFSEANLKGISVTDCDLLNATFERTNLENADLRHSFNYILDPELNRIKMAKFSQGAVLGLLKKYKISVE